MLLFLCYIYDFDMLVFVIAVKLLQFAIIVKLATKRQPGGRGSETVIDEV